MAAISTNGNGSRGQISAGYGSADYSGAEYGALEAAQVVRPRPVVPRMVSGKAPVAAQARDTAGLYAGRFARAQLVDAWQNAQALRPFRPDEFGAGPASPTAAHIRETNAFIQQLQRALLELVRRMEPSVAASAGQPSSANLRRFLTRRELALRGIKDLERIWDFYFELFGQRQTRFGPWLLGADRIGLDCYQAAYTGLGAARPVPTPPPFTYMETGFTPSTFRRGVVLTRLGKRKNPFPVIKLPYHRLVNPWTLGAIHHEVSHNLQTDLGLWLEVPKRLSANLPRAGLPPSVAATWTRWHKEIWADLAGLLLGGPGNITSLMGVVARSPRATLAYSPSAVHPTAYLRVLINLELLKRMGFPREAREFEQVWQRMYPNAQESNIPRQMLQTFPQASRAVVDTMCYQPYPQLGGKSLSEVVSFRPAHQEMVAEAAQRMAQGVDPGIIPARFLVGAARWALARNLAPPATITRNFYEALAKR